MSESERLTRNFTRGELTCKCGCGRMEIPMEFIEKLQELRDAFGGPLEVSSGYRCPGHNARVSGTGETGPHTIAAVDLRVSGHNAYRLLQLAQIIGFSGLGISQKGPRAGRFIHLDDLPAHQFPRPWVWSY